MLREITDKIEWEGLRQARLIPSGHFLQSWVWGEFQMSLGRKIHRFSDGQAIAQIVELPLPLRKKYWFCPKGPLMMNNGQWTMNNSILKELEQKTKGAGAIFLRFEPSAEVTNVKAKRSHDINPRYTTIVDLSKSEDDLLAAMHPKTRYNIKVAEKHRVEVCSSFIVHRSFEPVWQLFQETAKRDGFHLHPRAYYERQAKMPGIEVFTAECEGKLLAVAIVMFDPSTALGTGGVATYLHGASSNEMRNVMAPYALHWQIMKAAKERGCTRYDMWGISDDPKSSWAGITRFKRGWGGDEIRTVGTLDLPLNGFWYSVYRLARYLRP
jgi:lipid II:glycine glycyltransferase (peptidoglycan interpeptide bridge formation enzyme)